jgi:alpha-tubulin suppressor-like RCC1 family protein
VRVTQIAAGLEHTCALLSDQTVRCWGDNQHAAVGSASPSAVLAPQQLQLPPVEQLATGAGMHSCARLQSGQLACWGLNDRGQTGLASSTQPQRSPLLVAGVSSAVDVAVGAAHSCALQSDGAVLCWGSGERGQLGDGTRSDRNSPARVAQLPHALRIALGDKHGCALLRDNTVQCWGGNSFGEAGLPTHQSHAAAGLTLQVGTEALVPQAVAELPTATGISAGTSRSCALLEHGAVRCWGGERFEARAVPVKGVEHATALGVAGRHACALRADAKVVCWGNNEWGQLGDGTRRDRASAGLVDGLSEVESLGVGKEHTCAVLRDGSASCWGSNTGGKLGDGTRADRLRATPVAW